MVGEEAITCNMTSITEINKDLMVETNQGTMIEIKQDTTTEIKQDTTTDNRNKDLMIDNSKDMMIETKILTMGVKEETMADLDEMNMEETDMIAGIIIKVEAADIIKDIKTLKDRMITTEDTKIMIEEATIIKKMDTTKRGELDSTEETKITKKEVSIIGEIKIMKEEASRVEDTKIMREEVDMTEEIRILIVNLDLIKEFKIRVEEDLTEVGKIMAVLIKVWDLKEKISQAKDIKVNFKMSDLRGLARISPTRIDLKIQEMKGAVKANQEVSKMTAKDQGTDKMFVTIKEIQRFKKKSRDTILSFAMR